MPSWLRPWLDPRLAKPVASGRWVVVDVETSGLNVKQDALISIGALGVTDAAIDLADSFEVVLRQESPSTGANIEIHGIGGEEQMGGDDPAEALRAFLHFVREDPLVAFHAPFDAMVLGRAFKERLGINFRRCWLDLADLAPVAWPGRAAGGLDDWLHAIDVPMAFRHRAIVDCLGTAQLFLALLRETPRLGAPTKRRLLAMSRGDRWLS